MGSLYLKANISHYQGQITLLQATLQAKDATIFAQQTSIENLKSMLSNAMSSNALVISTQESNSKPLGDREEVLGGLAAITKFTPTKGGFEINLPEMYRRAKRLFIKEKD